MKKEDIEGRLPHKIGSKMREPSEAKKARHKMVGKMENKKIQMGQPTITLKSGEEWTAGKRFHTKRKHRLKSPGDEVPRLTHLSSRELGKFAGKKDTRAGLDAILHTRPGYYKEDVAKGGKFYRKN